VRLLPEEVPADADFIAATAGAVATQAASGARVRLHCAELAATRHRWWVRLVGTDFDVQVWTPPPAGDGGASISVWGWIQSAMPASVRFPAWSQPLLRCARDLPYGSGLTPVSQAETRTPRERWGTRPDTPQAPAVAAARSPPPPPPPPPGGGGGGGAAPPPPIPPCPLPQRLAHAPAHCWVFYQGSN